MGKKLVDPQKIGIEDQRFLVKLQTAVIGHPKELATVARAISRARVGITRGSRPLGMFLMVGPTGTGKTLLAEEICEALCGDRSLLLRIDGGEMAFQQDVSRILGAPPGWVGHKETVPIITNARLAMQHTTTNNISVVLFDEIDKAHSSLLDVLLGVMDVGSLRLGDNSQVQFEHTLVLMTANTGAREISDALSARWNLSGQATNVKQAAGLGLTAAKKLLRPEFFNRLDEVLIFEPLSETNIHIIAFREMDKLHKRLGAKGINIKISMSYEAMVKVVGEGYDPRYGARHLKRSLQKYVEDPLANLLSSKQVKGNDHLRLDLDKGEVVYEVL